MQANQVESTLMVGVWLSRNIGDYEACAGGTCGGSTGTESLKLWNDVGADGWSGPGWSSRSGYSAEQFQNQWVTAYDDASLCLLSPGSRYVALFMVTGHDVIPPSLLSTTSHLATNRGTHGKLPR